VHERLRGRSLRKHASIWENGILLLIGLAAYSLALVAHSNGVARKWVTALFATLIPFGLAIFLRRRNLPWPFWVALTICLAFHTAILWLFFLLVLSKAETFSILFCLPIMAVEPFVLLIATKKIEKALTGKNDRIRIGF
jgi:hypothetical protein